MADSLTMRGSFCGLCGGDIEVVEGEDHDAFWIALHRHCNKKIADAFPETPAWLFELMDRAVRLQRAIEKHRATPADDRCFLMDRELYAVLSDGKEPDFRVGDQWEMLKNCVRFIECRTSGGGWMTYESLLRVNGELRRLCESSGIDTSHVKAVIEEC